MKKLALSIVFLANIFVTKAQNETENNSSEIVTNTNDLELKTKTSDDSKVVKNKNLISTMVFEAGYGYQMILSPSEPNDIKDYGSFGNLQLGIRVPIDNSFGFRGVYNFQNFSKGDMGINTHKFIAEGTYTFLPIASDNHFKVLSHAGFGLGAIKSKQHGGESDLIGIFQLGLMPEYKFSDKVGLFLDLTYSMNFSQNYNFNGESMNEKFSGQTFIPTIGISIKPF